MATDPEVIQLFMLNSTEHENYHAHKCSNPTTVGILSVVNTTSGRLKARRVSIFFQKHCLY